MYAAIGTEVTKHPPSPIYLRTSESKYTQSSDTITSTSNVAHDTLNKDKTHKRKREDTLFATVKHRKSEKGSRKAENVFEDDEESVPTATSTQISAANEMELKEEFKRVRLELQQAKEAHQRALNQVDLALENEKTAHAKEVKTLKFQIANLKRKADEEKSSEIEGIERELHDLKLCYKDERKKCGQLSVVNKNLQKELDEHKSSKEELLIKVQKLEEERTQLKTENQTLHDSLEKQTATENELSNKLNQHKSSEEELLARVKKLEEQCTQLKTENQTLHDSLEKQTATENELRNELTITRGPYEQFLSTMMQLKEQSDQILKATLKVQARDLEMEGRLAKVNQLEIENYQLRLAKANFDNYFGSENNL